MRLSVVIAPALQHLDGAILLTLPDITRGADKVDHSLHTVVILQVDCRRLLYDAFITAVLGTAVTRESAETMLSFVQAQVMTVLSGMTDDLHRVILGDRGLGLDAASSGLSDLATVLLKANHSVAQVGKY
jgi:hypothetical protein